jgi:predicted phage tail protein
MTNLVIGSGGGGKGGGGGGSTSTAKDNLESKQFGRVLDLLSEGEIGGLVDGAKSIFLNDTPLQNANGTFNFKDVSYAERTGTSSQTVIPLTENTAQVQNTGLGTIVKNTPGVKQLTNSNIDAVKVTISVPQLQKITDDGDIEGSEIDLEIAVQYLGGSYQTKVSGDNGKIKGRTGDLYQREYVLKLDGAFPVNIKVTRITDDSTNPKLVNAFQWNTYTEIIYDSRAYPNSALVGLRLDAEQFSSIPKRTYLVKGIKVKVPHNATVRADGSLAYSGTFNGTLGAAVVTNDPAWILFDLLTTYRYGLGVDTTNGTGSTNTGYLAEADLDKFSFYAASVYASALISNGAGGTEPRFACNVNIQTAQEAYTVINQLCSVFRAQAYWQAGSVALTQDAPQDTSYLFSIANVLEPGFNYQTSSQKNRATVAVVKYFDNELRDYNYEEVKDNTNIARYGSIVRNIDAFACTSRAQAQRLGKWLLYTENNERETCSFVASIDAGVVCRPGQVIEIADEMRAGSRKSGRIKSATTTAITVDDATGLVTSNSPTLSAILSDGSVETKPISSISSGVVNLSSGFSSAPNANTLWVYQNSSIQTSTWRVVSVEEQDGINYGVTAVSYNSSKYANIESGISLTTRNVTNLNVAPAAPAAVEGIDSDGNAHTYPAIDTTELIYENLGSARVKIIVSWINNTANAYVRFRYNNNDWQSRIAEKTKQIEILDVVAGTYEIEVYSVSASGLRSVNPATKTHTAIGKTAPPTDVTGVTLTPINQERGLLQWDQSTEKDVLIGGKVLIAQSTNGSARWADATIVLEQDGNTTSGEVPLLPGLNAYLIKFKDDGGRISTGPSSNLIADWDATKATVVMPAVTDRLFVQFVDEHTANFTGTKTNTAYDSTLDSLRLSVSNNATAASGEYYFANSVDLTQIYDVNLTRELVSFMFDDESLWDSKSALIDTWGLIDDEVALTSSDCNAVVEYRATNDDPSSSPTWGDWQQIVNGLVRARGLQFRVKLTSTNVDQNIAIRRLGITVELQPRTESITNAVTTGSAPYQVNFAHGFYEPPSVFVTQVASNREVGDYPEIDNITRTGFEVTFKNTANDSSYARSFVWGASGFGNQVSV